MANEEQLAIAVVGKIDDFKRAMATVETRVAGVEKKIASDMKKVDASTRRAAQNMEKNFSKSVATINGKRINIPMPSMSAGMMGQGMGALGGIAGGAGIAGLAGGAAGGAFIRAINESAAAVVDLRAEAQRAGIEFEQFQRIVKGFGAERVSLDAVTDGLKELQLRADEFVQTGKGSAEEAFKRLGYNAVTLAEALKQPDQLLMQIMERMRGFDTAAQIRIADEVFGGTGGEQFVRAIDALDRVKQTMRDANVLTDAQADKAAEVTRAFDALTNELTTGVQGALTDIAHEIAVPILTAATNVLKTIQDWRKAADNFLAANVSDNFARTYTRPGGFFPGLLGMAGDAYRSLVPSNSDLDTQNEVIKLIQADLDEANRLAGLPESEVGATRIKMAKENAELLKQELAEATALLEQMKSAADGVIRLPEIVATTGTAAATAGGAPLRANAGVDTGNLTQAVKNGVSAVLAEHPELTINSGYRDPARNARARGAKHSQHMGGNAVDVEGVNENNVEAIVASFKKQGFRGFGYYNNGTMHADMGPARAWGPDRSSGSLGQTPVQFRNAVAGNPPMTPEDVAVAEANQEASARAAEVAKRAAEQQADADERRKEALDAVNEALARGLEIEQLRGELLKKGVSAEDADAAIQREIEARTMINQLKEAGVVVDAKMEESIRRRIALTGEEEAANQRLVDTQGQMKDVAIAMGQPIVDGLMSIVDGSAKAEDALKGVIKQIANMILQAAIFGQGPLGKMFGGGLIGAVFGGGGGLPGRAAGGPVESGKPYLVGEHRRPELFVPGSNRRIVDALAGGVQASTRRVNDGLDRMRETRSGRQNTHVTVGVSVDKNGNLDAFVKDISTKTARAHAEDAMRQMDHEMSGGPLLSRLDDAQSRYGSG